MQLQYLLKKQLKKEDSRLKIETKYMIYEKDLCYADPFYICASDEPKSELALDLGDRLQSQHVPIEHFRYLTNI